MTTATIDAWTAIKQRVESEAVYGLTIRNPYIRHAPTAKQEAFLRLTCEEAFYGGAAGGGKALSLDTEIATLCGWKRMGDLVEGDEVFSADGTPTMVLATSEVMTGRDCYRVKFSDGAEITADADHLWLTRTCAERISASHLTPEWRAARRARRASRGKGKRPDVVAKNQAKRWETKVPPIGELRTTKTIAATLLAGKRRAKNHAVAVASPLRLPALALPIEPYVLGVWLGDGSKASGLVTLADEGVVEAMQQCGIVMRKNSSLYGYRAVGLTTTLRLAGLLMNKHIPSAYLRASFGQRLALLQGLMDTDGTCGTDGHPTYTTTSRQLADGASELLASLGVKHAVCEGRARLYGRDCGPKFNLQFVTDLPVFRLQRKADRQKRGGFRGTHCERYVIAVEPVQSVPVRCIQVAHSSGMFLAGRQMVPTHNSDALLMAALQFVEVPGYSAILFRRTYADLSLPGALMDRAAEWLTPTAARWEGTRKTWTFPSGATLAFGYLENDRDQYRYQGAEFQAVGFDELTQFTESQYRYLFSRIRRLEGASVPLRMRAASNPGGVGHDWVRRRFIDEAGERVFVPAKLEDNPFLDTVEYEKALAQLDPITRAQLRHGDWDARAAGGWFNRDWFEIVEVMPAEATCVRYWDFAATPKKADNDPDWTAGPLIGMHEGVVYIADMQHLRETPHNVEKRVAQVAAVDGPYVSIYIEQEPGASGVQTIDHYRRRVLPGYAVRADKPTGAKDVRARPLSAAAEAGNVKLVRGRWITDFLDEAESFPYGAHDDQVDAAAGGLLAVGSMIVPMMMSI